MCELTITCSLLTVLRTTKHYLSVLICYVYYLYTPENHRLVRMVRQFDVNEMFTLLFFLYFLKRLPEQIKVKHEKMKEEMIGMC